MEPPGGYAKVAEDGSFTADVEEGISSLRAVHAQVLSGLLLSSVGS